MATIKYWNGSAWELAIVGKQGPAGPTGPTGPAGSASLQRFRFVATGGETSLSGTDANGNTLAYTAGLEEVFLNGAALVRGQDYIATNGTSITSLAALTATDVVEILAWGVFNVANTISNTLIDAKGDILAGSAADTVSRLAVGANDTVLTADSSTSTGLKWAATSAGGMTELASGSFPAAATLNLTLINQTYKDLVLVVRDVYLTVDDDIKIKFNSTATSNYPQLRRNAVNDVIGSAAGNGTAFAYLMGYGASVDNISGQANNAIVKIYDYSNTVSGKTFEILSQYKNSAYGDKIINITEGSYSLDTAISSINIETGSGNFAGGTYILYGVK